MQLILGVTDKRNSKPRQVSVNHFDTGKKQKSVRRCVKCGSSLHMVMNSPIKQNKVGNITAGSYLRSQSNSSVRGRFEDSDQGSSSARNDRTRTTGKKSEYSNYACM